MTTHALRSPLFAGDWKPEGVSSASADLATLESEAADHLAFPLSLDQGSRDLLELMLSTLDECLMPGWDGYGAAPVSPDAVQEALAFLRALPAYVALPDIVPEPSGAVGLEWSAGNRTFVVSFVGRRRAVFAGVLGAANKIHGVEQFVRSVPDTILQVLMRNFQRSE